MRNFPEIDGTGSFCLRDSSGFAWFPDLHLRRPALKQDLFPKARCLVHYCMGHGWGSQEEENPLFVRWDLKRPAVYGRPFGFAKLELVLSPALVLYEVGDHRDINVFSLIGLDAPVNVDYEADNPNTCADDDEAEDKGHDK